MNTSFAADDRVEDSLLPIDYLLINYRTRFFGALLVLLEKYETDTIDTAGVTVRDGRGCLAYNPDFMQGLSFQDRCQVLMHEASHLILSSMSRGIGRNKEFWNIATDIVINELIKQNYGLDCGKDAFSFAAMHRMKIITDKNMVSLHEQSADDIYNILLNSVKSIKIKRGYMKDDPKKQLVKIAEVETKAGGKFSFRFYGEPFDDDNIDGRLKGKIEELVKQAADLSYGSEAGNMVRGLRKVFGVYFPFDMILRKVFEKRDFDFSRRNRRFKEAETFFPRRKNPAYKVYAAIDVSGSCFDYTEQFLGYITALPEFEEVVFFDTKITQKLKKGQPIPKTARGFGGTDLNPVFQHWIGIEKKSQHVKLNFVVLTDGEVPDITRMTKTVPIVFTTHAEVKGCKNIKIRR